LGLKAETGYTPTNITLNRLYKNSILVKIWRTFEIEIKEDQIKLRAFFQLHSFIRMINIIIINLPAVERHLKRVIQMFLQFHKEYIIFPLEAMPIYGIMIEVDEYIDARRNQRHLVLVEREKLKVKRSRSYNARRSKKSELEYSDYSE
jgi:hypothetical protein